MISNLDIQNNYNHLYECLRNYIWPFDVVSAIADLEIACYKTCPSLLEVRTRLSQLRRVTQDVMQSDDEFNQTFEKFESDIADADDVYAVLNQVEEVKSDEDTEEVEPVGEEFEDVDESFDEDFDTELEPEN